MNVNFVKKQTNSNICQSEGDYSVILALQVGCVFGRIQEAPGFPSEVRGRFLKISGWATESFGFIYGILLARYKDKFEAFAKHKWFAKSFIICVSSLILGIAYIKFKHIVFIGDYFIKVLLGLSILVFILILN